MAATNTIIISFTNIIKEKLTSLFQQLVSIKAKIIKKETMSLKDH